MGRALITRTDGAGKFGIDYEINTEAIEFEEARLRTLLEDLLADIAEAEETLSEAAAAAQAAKEALEEAVKKLSGGPSDELKAALAQARDLVSQAVTALQATASAILAVMIFLDQSRAALPPETPPEVLAQYDAASAALGLAQSAAFDERTAQQDVDSLVSAAESAVNGSPPNMSTARQKVNEAKQQQGEVSSAHAQASARISEASTALNAISLPGGPEYADASAALADAKEAFSDITDAHSQAATLEAAVRSALDQATLLMQPGRPEAQDAVKQALKAAQEADLAARQAELALATLEAEIAASEEKLAELARVPRNQPMTVWCADYTEELPASRPLATIEVPGETPPTGEIVLRPAFKDDSINWHQDRDSVMVPARALSAAGCFYNLAMLPGWQVFRPQYRLAQIIAMNGDGTVDVEFITPLRSSQQRIQVEPRTMNDTRPPLTKVKVQYMDCDADAFALGDEVVVEFEERDAAKPRVIGFRDHPRPCTVLTIATPTAHLVPQGDPASGWQTRTPAPEAYGNMNWWNKEQRLEVSWVGPWGRYIWPRPLEELKAEIYHKGKVIAAPGPVIGAALRKQGNTVQALCVTVEYTSTGDEQFTERLWLKQDIRGAGDDWTELASHSYPQWIEKESGGSSGTEGYPNIQHYVFNASATEAVSTKFFIPVEFWTPPGGEVPNRYTTDWQRVFRLHVPVAGAATFEITAAQSILAQWQQGDDGADVIENVAVDFRGDVEISASLHRNWSSAPSDQSCFTTLKAGEWSIDFGGGWQIAGPEVGKKILALDLRLDPPMVIYHEVEFVGSFGDIRYAYRPHWHVNDTERPLGETWENPTGYSSFANRFFVTRLARDSQSYSQEWYEQWLATLASLPSTAAVVSYPHNQINDLWPETDLSTLLGTTDYVDNIGVSSR